MVNSNGFMTKNWANKDNISYAAHALRQMPSDKEFITILNKSTVTIDKSRFPNLSNVARSDISLIARTALSRINGQSSYAVSEKEFEAISFLTEFFINQKENSTAYSCADNLREALSHIKIVQSNGRRI